MVNDHIEARLWGDHGREFNESIASGLARLSRLMRRIARRTASVDPDRHPGAAPNPNVGP